MAPEIQAGTGENLGGRSSGRAEAKAGEHRTSLSHSNLIVPLLAKCEFSHGPQEACCQLWAEVWTQGDSRSHWKGPVGLEGASQGWLGPRTGPKPWTHRRLTCQHSLLCWLLC